MNILTVSELTFRIRDLLEANFRHVKLSGEVSNCKLHEKSGHLYFTLKDEHAQIRVVMWRSANIRLPFLPENGMNVVVTGKITVYPGKGVYQLEARDLVPLGAGELQMRFEKLKQLLFEEGLFDEAHKKPLPKYPEHIAVITSKGSAALQDFVNITRRRYPLLNLYVYPVNVQGYTASGEIAKALRNLELFRESGFLPAIDLIVIARGGGSLEDLWPFNDESLARAIFKCSIPVVSAIGHEVDYTICDFVADLRAPTPSAAAELVTPSMNELVENISKFPYFYRSYVQSRMKNLRNRLDEIQRNYYFNRPKDLISDYGRQIEDTTKTITILLQNKLNALANHLASCYQTLHHVNPENNLKKGYAVIFKDHQSHMGQEKSLLSFDLTKLVTKSSDLSYGESVYIKLYDGQKLAEIK
jgi:exodeoxyribonuclease VII large subunit